MVCHVRSDLGRVRQYASGGACSWASVAVVAMVTGSASGALADMCQGQVWPRLWLARAAAIAVRWTHGHDGASGRCQGVWSRGAGRAVHRGGAVGSAVQGPGCGWSGRADRHSGNI